MSFRRLEPCEGKLSSTVLRGLGAGNSPRLPDQQINNLLNLSYKMAKKVWAVFRKSSRFFLKIVLS